MIGIKRKPFLPGIDIGTASIKFVVLSGTPEAPQLADCDVIAIDDRASGSYVEALEVISKRLPVKEVNVSLSGPSVIVRYIEMPRMTDDELKSSMRYEAEKHIPFDIKDVIFDCQILEHSSHGKIYVLLAAAKREAVFGRLDLIGKAGLRAATIDCDAFAFTNAFLLNFSHDLAEDENIGLVNLGERSMIINILKGKTARFTRESQIGGWDFTKMIADKLKIDTRAASALKENPGQRYNDILEIVRPVITQMIEEIKLSLGYYENQMGQGVARVYISGGLAGFKGLKELFAENLGVDCIAWNLFKAIRPAKEMPQEELDKKKDRLAVALGLALR